MPEGFDLLVGMDALYRFGFGIPVFLDENKTTPKDSFCTIPESKVYLGTQPGVAAQKRKHPSSHYHEKIVQYVILEWLKNRTIFKLIKRSAFNIPLILVVKKDLKGNKTSFRPCLDPRHLNLLLEDDDVELPLIKDIFQALAGSIVFSTIDLTKAYHCF
ncbi:hypothetical protein B0O80DRAFT_492696 [Mortierella sp. GBAus27b]|nr:hypothetical protein B0O80DRAFT_492696 [Mortierella sp. GBAus27b]